MNINKILIIAAVVLFILAGLGVANTVAWGLAALAGSFLV